MMLFQRLNIDSIVSKISTKCVKEREQGESKGERKDKNAFRIDTQFDTHN